MIFMKPNRVCLFESGSLTTSLLQLWLLSAPVAVAIYWNFSSNCCRKWDLALDSGFKIFLTCCDIVPHFQILSPSKVKLTRIRIPTLIPTSSYFFMSSNMLVASLLTSNNRKVAKLTDSVIYFVE